MASGTAARLAPLVLALSLGGIPALAGCGALAGAPAAGATDEDGETAAESRRQPIINGTLDTQPAHRAVVALTYGAGAQNFCSGTLIAPDVVLTAGHCLRSVTPGTVYVYFGSDVDQGGQWVSVAEVMPHPRYDGDAYTFDLGLLRLAEAAPADATPIPFLPATLGLQTADEGAAVEFVGFGRTESFTSGRKLTVPGTVGKVCDGPEVCSLGAGQVVPGAFGYSMAPGGPCSGDSGGPAFILRGGVEHVAGVTSYGDENCAYYGVSTRPDAYAAWIEAFVAGVREDCTTAEDEDHDTLAGCADPDCDGDPACPAGDACQSAEAISCGDVIQGSTLGGSHKFRSYSCAGQELGPEKAYLVTAPRGLTMTARLTMDGTGDLDLFLLPPFGMTCATWDCLAVSAEPGLSTEEIRFTKGADDELLVVDTWDAPGAYTLELVCATSPERCDNRIDDDADGLTDCDDPDCGADPWCAPPPENCLNGLDDDGDGAVDCDDPDCAESSLCKSAPKKKGCQQGSASSGLWLAVLILFLGSLRRRRPGKHR
ncbi:MAG: serine protease [Polyangia bacterium]|jgi:hypothetical protein|nr:serine protease [Polyangia bacterium]